MLGSIILVMFFGFITGGLARLAVPGPDPMPVWLTVAIGLVGSAAGGAIAIAIWGRGTQAIGLLSFLGAVLLVVAYRRFVQKRPLTGPDALKFPERGIGIDKFQERRHKMEELVRQAQGAQSAQAESSADSNLRKLSDLHDAGILTDEEYEAKKAQLQGSV
ncbi:MAG: Short C-terminal domain [Gaiellaceae bacterium]|nr:Short C-terminal domain [Gaiellaceae bacterium]